MPYKLFYSLFKTSSIQLNAAETVGNTMVFESRINPKNIEAVSPFLKTIIYLLRLKLIYFLSVSNLSLFVTGKYKLPENGK